MTGAGRRALPVLLAAGAVIAAACAPTSDPFDFGIKRLALDLAFSEEELAEPVEPEVIVRIIPAPPEIVAEPERLQPPPPEPPPPPPPFVPDCPSAPPGAAPREVVTFDLSGPPAPGVYRRHNTGTVTVTGGPFPITLPFPPETRWVIPAIEQVEQPPLLGGDDGPLPPVTTSPEPVVFTEWDVEKILTDTFRIIDRYRITDTGIELIRRTTVTVDGETVFEPTPPVLFFSLGPEGTTWESNSVDLDNGTAMRLEGRTEAREVIDVCGEVFDTYRFTTAETVVNLNTGETSGTPSDAPNVHNIATHLGGLILREQITLDQTTRDPDSGSPLLIELRYTSTLSSITPDPLPGGAG